MGADTLDSAILKLLKIMGPPSGDERYVQGYRQAMYDLINEINLVEASAIYYLYNTQNQFERF